MAIKRKLSKKRAVAYRNPPTPRLAPGASPEEMTYALIGELYAAMSLATSRLARRGTIDAGVGERAVALDKWLKSPESSAASSEARELGRVAFNAASSTFVYLMLARA